MFMIYLTKYIRPNEDFISAPRSPHVMNLEPGDVVKFQYTNISLQGSFVNPEICSLENSSWNDILTESISFLSLLKDQ